ncbi:unnamed protein product [Prorocentrum cordatum]|uniref:Uncharacterized protein n=1 Tax=Prorocentrum cordatum TaxID=2364126 RepID=A0ABN9WTR4_9DINO|nr:unnamed protein product [Polarella glacialis]
MRWQLPVVDGAAEEPRAGAGGEAPERPCAEQAARRPDAEGSGRAADALRERGGDAAVGEDAIVRHPDEASGTQAGEALATGALSEQGGGGSELGGEELRRLSRQLAAAVITRSERGAALPTLLHGGPARGVGSGRPAPGAGGSRGALCARLPAKAPQGPAEAAEALGGKGGGGEGPGAGSDSGRGDDGEGGAGPSPSGQEGLQRPRALQRRR